MNGRENEAMRKIIQLVIALYIALFSVPSPQESRTPLHWATINGHSKSISLLLAGGANIEAIINKVGG